MTRTDKTSWLLALDGSRNAERAARYVAWTATRQGIAEIHVVNVQPLDNLGAYALRSTQITRRAHEAAKHDTAAARRILESASLSIRLHAFFGGDPATKIAEAARRQRVREIVMGTRGMSAMGNLGLGSVAYKVVHLARQPVTLVPPPRGGGKAAPSPIPETLSLVLAVDGSRHAIRAADYLCRLHEAGLALDVHVLNVQPRIVSGNVRRFVSQAQIDAYYRKQGEHALRGARRRLDRSGIKYQCHIKAGALAETIVQVATGNTCMRIVMGTRGLAAVKGLLFGSVTYSVVHLSEMPVTLVK